MRIVTVPAKKKRTDKVLIRVKDIDGFDMHEEWSAFYGSGVIIYSDGSLGVSLRCCLSLDEQDEFYIWRRLAVWVFPRVVEPVK